MVWKTNFYIQFFNSFCKWQAAGTGYLCNSFPANTGARNSPGTIRLNICAFYGVNFNILPYSCAKLNKSIYFPNLRQCLHFKKNRYPNTYFQTNEL